MQAEVFRAYMMGATTQEIMRIFDLTVPELCAIIEDQLASEANHEGV